MSAELPTERPSDDARDVYRMPTPEELNAIRSERRLKHVKDIRSGLNDVEIGNNQLDSEAAKESVDHMEAGDETLF
ncbi:MAG TPA: hypothetical protein VLE72_02165 [Candidatus Saccharimonadales bacterium]|nr:hypothetical protein [Candidatus Saccharimonadales bacterium]